MNIKIVVAIVASVIALSGCSTNRDTPKPVSTTAEPTQMAPESPDPAPSEIPSPVRGDDFISYMRRNVDDLGGVPDVILSNSGDVICGDLRTGRSVKDELSYLAGGPPNMSSNTAAHLVYASVKFKCIDQYDRVKDELDNDYSQVL